MIQGSVQKQINLNKNEHFIAKLFLEETEKQKSMMTRNKTGECLFIS